ncbi:hypothetical protein ACN9M0_38680 [Streptomyces sp. R-07]|uniref:hypothetical protein n=1 Tax=Streptomyces sp. R-07 TaxID=3404052 RepID=UPI003CF09636
MPTDEARRLLESDGERSRQKCGEVVVRALALRPGVEGDGFAEAVLEGEDGEAAVFDGEPQDAPAHGGELVDEVAVFAQGDHPGTVEDVAQRFQVVQGGAAGSRWLSGVAWPRSQSVKGVRSLAGGMLVALPRGKW